jgi:tRNA(Arg) A34 adenosine deaminase TadA
VAARRVSWQESWESLFALLDSRDWDRIEEVTAPLIEIARPVGPGPDLEPFELLRTWRSQASKEEHSQELVPVVAGIRISGEADFLRARLNQARRIRTRHAEVQLVHDMLRARPAGARLELWVTLKCCKMCAAWIFEAFAGPNRFKGFEVIYENPDPGRLGRFTALEASSPQRRAAVRALGLSDDWITRVVEWHDESR